MSRLSEKKVSFAAVLLIMCFELYRFMDFRTSCSMMISGGEHTITIPMRQAMSGEVQLSQDDPRVIKYILETGIIVPPSKLPYNLSHPNEDYGAGWGVQPPMTVIRTVLRELNMTHGDRFFVECGVYDGETLSNSLYLEKNLGWKGLLVEGDPLNYEKLEGKNRKAWLSKTCLSIHPYPHRARFLLNSVYGKVLESGTSESKKRNEVEVQCVPLFTLLSAINVTTVDYFSLDVEGNEYKVLKTIPFDNVFIKTLTVEYARGKDKTELLKFMKNKGYIEIGKTKFPKKWHHDFLFVHEKVISINNHTKNLS